MKKTLVTPLAASLCFPSLPAFATAEISQQEADSLKYIKPITVAENTMNQCMYEISKMTGRGGVDFSITRDFSSTDDGSQVVVTGELYKK